MQILNVQKKLRKSSFDFWIITFIVVAVKSHHYNVIRSGRVKT